MICHVWYKCQPCICGLQKQLKLTFYPGDSVALIRWWVLFLRQHFKETTFPKCLVLGLDFPLAKKKMTLGLKSQLPTTTICWSRSGTIIYNTKHFDAPVAVSHMRSPGTLSVISSWFVAPVKLSGPQTPTPPQPQHRQPPSSLFIHASRNEISFTS